jgi:Flp pilus assembly protein TadB
LFVVVKKPKNGPSGHRGSPALFLLAVVVVFVVFVDVFVVFVDVVSSRSFVVVVVTVCLFSRRVRK